MEVLVIIRYACGTDARVGDHVNLAGQPSVVEEVLDTPEKCAEWDLTERGLMLKSAAFGLVFEDVSSSGWEDVVCLDRGAS